MQRLIKFRAKNKLNGIWWYGSTNADRIDYSTNTLPMVTFWRWIGEGALDIETLGQYIGLEEKNEVEVWEGDLYRDKGCMYPIEVYYDERYAEFKGRVNGEMQPDKTRSLMWHRSWEVIGNVHSKEEKDGNV